MGVLDDAERVWAAERGSKSGSSLHLLVVLVMKPLCINSPRRVHRAVHITRIRLFLERAKALQRTDERIFFSNNSIHLSKLNLPRSGEFTIMQEGPAPHTTGHVATSRRFLVFRLSYLKSKYR